MSRDLELEEILVGGLAEFFEVDAVAGDILDELVAEGAFGGVVYAQDGEVLDDDDFGDVVLGERQECGGEACESCQ